MSRRWYRGKQSSCERTIVAIGFGNDAASNSQLRHNGCEYVLAFGKEIQRDRANDSVVLVWKKRGDTLALATGAGTGTFLQSLARKKSK